MNNGLIDTHSHILYGVDDGSKTIDESLALLQRLSRVGFSKVILTPHYIEDSYNESKINNYNRYIELKNRVKEDNIDIELYLGNEIYITNNIVSLLKNGIVSSLNNSRYVLVELPFFDYINGIDDLLYELSYSGYIPVIAHPERYAYFQKNPKLLDNFIENGVLFQVNYASIIGFYGNNAKKLVEYMLKNDLVSFFGTDIHSMRRTTVCDDFLKVKKLIIKIIGEAKFNEINDNSMKSISEEIFVG